MNAIAASLCAAVVLLATPAWADLSRDAAVAVAQRQNGGRVLSVEKAESAGRVVWRVKLVTAKGEVRVVLVDAVSGQAF